MKLYLRKNNIYNLLRSIHNPSTIVYEALHCLGLAHTFDYRIPKRSFIAYRYAKTNNILDSLVSTKRN